MKSVYVGNLPYATTENELKELFTQFGQVFGARIKTDRDTGRPLGYGFVQMEDADADKAIEALDGKDIGGRNLRVNESRERTDRPPHKDYEHGSDSRPPQNDRGGYDNRPPRRDFNDRGGGYDNRPPQSDRGGYDSRPPRRDFNDRGGGYDSRPPQRDFNDRGGGYASRPPHRDFDSGRGDGDGGHFGKKSDSFDTGVFGEKPRRREFKKNDKPRKDFRDSDKPRHPFPKNEIRKKKIRPDEDFDQEE